MKTVKDYFGQSFLGLILAVFCFFLFKKILPNKLFPTPKGVSKNIVVDSLLLEALSDEKEIDSLTKKEIKKSEITEKEAIAVGDSLHMAFLQNFYEKLYQLEVDSTHRLRIAYFSDSMTDGDLIVQDLRASFQEEYGGEGVGFVNIVSESASARSSLTHDFSKNWVTYSFLRGKKTFWPYGISGNTFIANDSIVFPWVKFKASKRKRISSLPNPTLFYGFSSNQKGKVYAIDGKDTTEFNLFPKNKINKLVLSKVNKKAIQLLFKGTDSIPFFGLNFDDGIGVHIDNFSSRGNSGLPLSTFNVDLMNNFQHELNYDLIVLHYGTNVLNYGSLDYSFYSRKMCKVIQHLKLCFPNADFLVISTADKSTKYDLEMKTDSAVVPLLKEQKKYALLSESGFVNLYKLMGGEGSMIKWVEEEPSKANRDYTHFNFTGSKEIASLIYQEIKKGYNEYKKIRKHKRLFIE